MVWDKWKFLFPSAMNLAVFYEIDEKSKGISMFSTYNFLKIDAHFNLHSSILMEMSLFSYLWEKYLLWNR